MINPYADLAARCRVELSRVRASRDALLSSPRSERAEHFQRLIDTVHRAMPLLGREETWIAADIPAQVERHGFAAREFFTAEPSPIPRAPTTVDPYSSPDREMRYARAALDAEVSELAALGAGRNVALTRTAFVLGQLCPPLTGEEVEAELVSACSANGSWKAHGRQSCLGTIRRGLRAGKREPRKPR